VAPQRDEICIILYYCIVLYCIILGQAYSRERDLSEWRLRCPQIVGYSQTPVSTKVICSTARLLKTAVKKTSSSVGKDPVTALGVGEWSSGIDVCRIRANSVFYRGGRRV